MLQKVTRGIRISVKTNFQGTFFKEYKLNFVFGYQITIENQSNDSVQLNSRFWLIKDALGKNEVVQGEGVIGEKPVLKPGESHTYSSGCPITSPFGAMGGHYNMINLSSAHKFKVFIPSFKLTVPFAIN